MNKMNKIKYKLTAYCSAQLLHHDKASGVMGIGEPSRFCSYYIWSLSLTQTSKFCYLLEMVGCHLCLEVVCWMEPDGHDHSEHDWDSDIRGEIFPGEVTLARSGAPRHDTAENVTRSFL